MSEGFEQFAIVELFGHNIIAGKVTEQVIGGQGFVRVDVPTVDDHEGFTKFYGAGAIYAITPCDEKAMLAAVQGLRQGAWSSPQAIASFCFMPRESSPGRAFLLPAISSSSSNWSATGS